MRYLLALHGALEWQRSADAVDSVREMREEEGEPHAENEALWEQICDADYFEVLGLHWSTTPSKIRPAFERLRAEWGPGGSKREPDREVGAKIWRRMEEAYRTLSETTSRRTYRKKTFKLVWSQQVELLVDRAKIALYRKDIQEAKDLLEACLDIERTEEALRLLKKMRDVVEGRGGKDDLEE